MGRTQPAPVEEPPPLDRAAAADDVLVAAAQRDRAAFAPLYERYAGPVYRYCYRRLGDHAAAEDATSQTFLKVLDGLHRFRGGSFRAWLFTIAERVVVDRYRRQRPEVGLDAALMVASAERGPEDLVLVAESRRSFHAALGRLTPDQRRIVALRLAGLTGPEISAVLGRDPDAVKGLQYRAYARLRRLLGDGGGTT